MPVLAPYPQGDIHSGSMGWGCPLSHIVSRNKLANVGDQIIPNVVGFLNHLRITFVPRKLHSLVDNLERVHRGDVVELRGESGGVVHALVVAGDH